ncbi:MAG: methyltransferase [Planctomycetota bacterium]|nr:MAG: methyltransferase [Planctomycetota bacterium]
MASISHSNSSPEGAPNSRPEPVCRSCGQGQLQSILNLGATPLVARFLDRSNYLDPEPYFPLELVFCSGCTLVQILETVRAEDLFQDDYPYYSSVSDAWVEHCCMHAQNLMQKRELDSQSLVVELASNDGCLLKNFVQAGIPSLGIDPAEGPAAAAVMSGVPTLVEFFSEELAHHLVSQGKTADLILGNNVLAHSTDTNDFVAGVAALLKDDGIAVFEMPYLKELIDHTEFDTIYHEHLCYFSVHALEALFHRHGLFLNDVEALPTHGGSIRITVAKIASPSMAKLRFLREEEMAGMLGFEYYADFAQNVKHLVEDLRQLLKKLKSGGARIAAYGAAAKGCVLLNYAGIGDDLLDYVVDKSLHKQGKQMPGVHLPVYAPEHLTNDAPDYLLLLSWNFREEILAQQKAYTDCGGKFILPVPFPHIHSS